MIYIRKTKMSDVACIKKVEDDCFSSPWQKKSIEIFAANSSTHICFVAVDSESTDRVVGYIAALYTGPEAEIANLAVLKKYQNQGVGDAMVSYLLRHFKEQNVKSVFLEVRKSNLSAIHVYNKNGFVPVGVRKNYYSNPTEDAHILRYDSG